MLREGVWASAIISMFASTSLARKRFTSAPALKNFSLALRTTTTRTSSWLVASPIVSARSSMNCRS